MKRILLAAFVAMVLLLAIMVMRASMLESL